MVSGSGRSSTELFGQRSHEPAPELRGMTTWASAATASGSSAASRPLHRRPDGFRWLGDVGRFGRNSGCADVGFPRRLSGRVARVRVHHADQRALGVGRCDLLVVGAGLGRDVGLGRSLGLGGRSLGVRLNRIAVLRDFGLGRRIDDGSFRCGLLVCLGLSPLSNCAAATASATLPELSAIVSAGTWVSLTT